MIVYRKQLENGLLFIVERVRNEARYTIYSILGEDYTAISTLHGFSNKTHLHEWVFSVFENEPITYLANFFTRDELRNHGYGRMLMSEVIDYHRNNDKRTLYVGVYPRGGKLEFMGRLNNFYDRLGFKDIEHPIPPHKQSLFYRGVNYKYIRTQ